MKTDYLSFSLDKFCGLMDHLYGMIKFYMDYVHIYLKV